MATNTAPSQWHGATMADLATVIAVLEAQNKKPAEQQ